MPNTRSSFRSLSHGFKSLLLVVLFAAPAFGAALTLLESFRDGEAGVDGLEGATDVAVSGPGGYVYVASSIDDAVAVFSRDATNDTLTFRQFFQDGVNSVFALGGAAGVSSSPDGAHVYVTSRDEDAVSVFRHLPGTGQLAFTGVVKQDGVGGIFGLRGATATLVSPAGNHLFVTGSTDASVVLFSRDATLDELAMVDFESAGFDLQGASGIALSPDLRHAYATASLSDSLVAFSYDATLDTSAALTFLEEYNNNDRGVDGLGSASAITLSPDGRQVYVTGGDPGSLATFSRNSRTGQLTLIDVLRADIDKSLFFLYGASDVKVTPDGQTVLVTSQQRDSLMAFDRDSATGIVSYRAVFRDGFGPIQNLAGASGVGVSADGENIYVSAAEDDALTSFMLNFLFKDGFETGDTSRWPMSFPVGNR